MAKMKTRASKSTIKKRPATRKSNADVSHPLEGKNAPAFELPTAGGKTASLSDLTRGRNLVLYFYPKDMTPGCTIEACDFRDGLARIRSAGAEVAGISGDSTESHRKFADRHSLNFTLLSDVGNSVAKRYGVYKEKSMYGRKFMGIVRTTFLIDKNGSVRKVFPKVKVAGHTDEVIAALKEMR
ncbi:MAG: thioredoxin-dependent thiol peroxidase [Candidatus Binataceae bacterium]